MGIRFVIGSLIALVAVAPSLGETPLGTTFTYQGQLKQGGAPFDGTADFQFTLWDAAGSGNPPTGGVQVGGAQAINARPVTSGLFTVALNGANEFGANAFNGNARWVQIAVRSPAGGGVFTTLAPRQPMNATPYAFFALSVPGGAADGHSLDAADGSPTDVVFVNNSGSVGIGTTDPASAVDIVFDSSTQTPQLTLRETALDYARLTFRTGYLAPFWTIAGFAAGQAVNDRLNFYYSETGDILSITGEGKVGIGTPSPTHTLTLQSTDNLTLRLIGPTSQYGYGARLNFGDGNFSFVEEDQDDKLNFRANRFAFSGGFVGIGTTNPAGILHVVGLPGNDSVILPTSAIGRDEILDEPGLASRLRTLENDGELVVPESPGMLMSRTITTPGSGYVLAIAYVDLDGGDQRGEIGISPTVGLFGTETVHFGGSVPVEQWDESSRVNVQGTHSVSFHAVYTIGPGSYTFYLNGRNTDGYDNGTVRVHDARLTLLYFPTAYGTVDVSSTADLNGLAAATQPPAQATDAPLATSTTGASSTTARSEEINNSLHRMVERQQATIEELLQRVGALEGKSAP